MEWLHPVCEAESPEEGGQFYYSIVDDAMRHLYGHRLEYNKDGHKGQYFVNFPDGRILLVDYTADKFGYKPRIKYLRNEEELEAFVRSEEEIRSSARALPMDQKVKKIEEKFSKSAADHLSDEHENILILKEHGVPLDSVTGDTPTTKSESEALLKNNLLLKEKITSTTRPQSGISQGSVPHLNATNDITSPKVTSRPLIQQNIALTESIITVTTKPTGVPLPSLIPASVSITTAASVPIATTTASPLSSKSEEKNTRSFKLGNTDSLKPIEKTTGVPLSSSNKLFNPKNSFENGVKDSPPAHVTTIPVTESHKNKIIPDVTEFAKTSHNLPQNTRNVGISLNIGTRSTTVKPISTTASTITSTSALINAILTTQQNNLAENTLQKRISSLIENNPLSGPDSVGIPLPVSKKQEPTSLNKGKNPHVPANFKNVGNSRPSIQSNKPVVQNLNTAKPAIVGLPLPLNNDNISNNVLEILPLFVTQPTENSFITFPQFPNEFNSQNPQALNSDITEFSTRLPESADANVSTFQSSLPQETFFTTVENLEPVSFTTVAETSSTDTDINSQGLSTLSNLILTDSEITLQNNDVKQTKSVQLVQASPQEGKTLIASDTSRLFAADQNNNLKNTEKQTFTELPLLSLIDEQNEDNTLILINSQLPMGDLVTIQSDNLNEILSTHSTDSPTAQAAVTESTPEDVAYTFVPISWPGTIEELLGDEDILYVSPGTINGQLPVVLTFLPKNQEEVISNSETNDHSFGLQNNQNHLQFYTLALIPPDGRPLGGSLLHLNGYNLLDLPQLREEHEHSILGGHQFGVLRSSKKS